MTRALTAIYEMQQCAMQHIRHCYFDDDTLSVQLMHQTCSSVEGTSTDEADVRFAKPMGIPSEPVTAPDVAPPTA